MNVLLLSMPDSFEHTPTVAIRMPNGALASLAGNLEQGHRVAIADLILRQRRVAETVDRLLAEHAPDVVGLSVMTFQRETSLRIARLIRRFKPQAQIVFGGYDPSLAPDAYAAEDSPADYIVRGEGELTFRALVEALAASSRRIRDIPGLSYRTPTGFAHNPARPISRLGEEIRLPDRGARVLDDYTFLGRKVDVVETSRGCTYDCSFCSIIEMRGRNFHVFPIERVLADIADARRRGARAIFLVDDNITLNVRRFTSLCEAIAASGFSDVDFIVQAMTSAVAEHGAELAPAMKRAGMRYVFLGIENVVEDDLAFLRARAKNVRRGDRAGENASLRAIELLHQHGMYIVGGLIVGNPADTRASIEANLAFARRYVDWPYIQHPTPYPGTPMTKEFDAKGLIVNDDVQAYDGTTAVVRTEHLPAEEAEFLRWRAERWMKARHMPAAFMHSPWFVARNARQMFAHTFRGSTWKTWLRLEGEREAFRRYRAIRRAERNYLAAEVPRPP